MESVITHDEQKQKIELFILKIIQLLEFSNLDKKHDVQNDENLIFLHRLIIKNINLEEFKISPEEMEILIPIIAKTFMIIGCFITYSKEYKYNKTSKTINYLTREIDTICFMDVETFFELFQLFAKQYGPNIDIFMRDANFFQKLASEYNQFNTTIFLPFMAIDLEKFMYVLKEATVENNYYQNLKIAAYSSFWNDLFTRNSIVSYTFYFSKRLKGVLSDQKRFVEFNLSTFYNKYIAYPRCCFDFWKSVSEAIEIQNMIESECFIDLLQQMGESMEDFLYILSIFMSSNFANQINMRVEKIKLNHLISIAKYNLSDQTIKQNDHLKKCLKHIIELNKTIKNNCIVCTYNHGFVLNESSKNVTYKEYHTLEDNDDNKEKEYDISIIEINKYSKNIFNVLNINAAMRLKILSTKMFLLSNIYDNPNDFYINHHLVKIYRKNTKIIPTINFKDITQIIKFDQEYVFNMKLNEILNSSQIKTIVSLFRFKIIYRHDNREKFFENLFDVNYIINGISDYYNYVQHSISKETKMIIMRDVVNGYSDIGIVKFFKELIIFLLTNTKNEE